jgi:hypothetical protein
MYLHIIEYNQNCNLNHSCNLQLGGKRMSGYSHNQIGDFFPTNFVTLLLFLNWEIFGICLISSVNLSKFF